VIELDELVGAIVSGDVIPSKHSLDEAADDNLVLGEIYDSVIESGELIEDYPDAYPAPSCLILGFNTVGDPIHSVWSYDPIRRRAKLITVYRPDSERWINWRIRK
jgi:Domain of unknown function (DUF4258)